MTGDGSRVRGAWARGREFVGAPPGSLRYFSVLFAPSRSRPLLDTLYAFEAEMRGLLHASSHEAAHARLQWWRGEVDRLAAGRPQHPVTTALLSLRDCASGDVSLLHEMLTAADLDLARMTYGSWQELEAYCFRATGSLQTLATAALAGSTPPSPAAQEFARRLGSALRQTEMLCDMANDLARGRIYAPLDVLAAAGIEPAHVQSGGTAPLQQVVADWRRRVEQSFAQLPDGLDPAEQRMLRPALVLAALHQRLLGRLRRPDSSTGRAEVPPWSRLWTAWRTAVRYA